MLSCSKVAVQICRCTNQAPGVESWRERPAWKHGALEHLDGIMKASIAQVDRRVFHTAGHYQSGPLQMRSARTDGDIKFAAWLFSEVSIVACRWNRGETAPAFDKISVSHRCLAGPTASSLVSQFSSAPRMCTGTKFLSQWSEILNAIRNGARSTVDSSLLFGIDYPLRSQRVPS